MPHVLFFLKTCWAMPASLTVTSLLVHNTEPLRIQECKTSLKGGSHYVSWGEMCGDGNMWQICPHVNHISKFCFAQTWKFIIDHNFHCLSIFDVGTSCGFELFSLKGIWHSIVSHNQLVQTWQQPEKELIQFTANYFDYKAIKQEIFQISASPSLSETENLQLFSL